MKVKNLFYGKCTKCTKLETFPKSCIFPIHPIENDVRSPAKLFYDNVEPEVAQLRQPTAEFVSNLESMQGNISVFWKISIIEIIGFFQNSSGVN